MANSYGPKGIVGNGIVWALDPANKRSYVGSGTATTDIVGNTTGTLQSGATFSDTNVGIFDFNGSTGYVTMGDILDQDGTSAFSMSFWLNLDALPGVAGAHIVGKMLNSGTYAGYSAYIYSNKLRFAIINSWSSNALAVDTVDDFATGSWKHVVVTYDGGQDVSDVKIYINGSSQTLTTIHNALSSSSTTTAPFTIGARNANSLYMNGKIGPCMVYDRELTAGEVLQNYNAQKSRFGL